MYKSSKETIKNRCNEYVHDKFKDKFGIWQTNLSGEEDWLVVKANKQYNDSDFKVIYYCLVQR